MPRFRPLAIKSWAKSALEENRRSEFDLRAQRKELARLKKAGADPKTIAEIEKRIVAMERRVRDAKR